MTTLAQHALPPDVLDNDSMTRREPMNLPDSCRLGKVHPSLVTITRDLSLSGTSQGEKLKRHSCKEILRHFFGKETKQRSLQSDGPFTSNDSDGQTSPSPALAEFLKKGKIELVIDRVGSKHIIQTSRNTKTYFLHVKQEAQQQNSGPTISSPNPRCST